MSMCLRSAGAQASFVRPSLSARPAAPVSRPVFSRTPAVAVRAIFKGAPPKGKKAPPPPKPTTLKLGFTASNELFVGRAAMLGFAFSLVGEILTGKGALGQLGYEIFDDKVNIEQIDELVVGLIVFNLIAAILPTSGTFVPEEEELQREPGALQDPKKSLLRPLEFFGVKGFGFTKENELFVGRTAQLGFAASLIGETLTGKGPLAQFDFETGESLRDTEFGLLVFIGFFFFAAINPGTGKFVEDEEEEEA